MIKKLSLDSNEKLEFKKKYDHIYQYFKERYRLINMYTAGEQLDNFLCKQITIPV